MLLIFDDNSEHVAHVWRKTLFFESATATDQNKCFKEIKFPISVHTYFELPSNISSIGTVAVVITLKMLR